MSESFPLGNGARARTERDDDPEEVHEEVVAPKVVGLGPAVGNVKDVMVEHAGGVVEDVAVELAQRDDDLQGVTQGAVRCDHVCHEERERSPADLIPACQQVTRGRLGDQDVRL